jgi:hypothetical protein
MVTPELIHQSINDSIAFLNAQLTKLQTQINDHIDRYPGLKKDLGFLAKYPSNRPQSGMQLLAVMHTHQVQYGRAIISLFRSGADRATIRFITTRAR